MKRLLLLLLLLNFSGILLVKAQDTASIKNLLCRFKVPRKETNAERGTGVIIARRADTLYLVTAGHVIRDHAPGTPIMVTLGSATTDTLVATLKLLRDPVKGDLEDLAVCSVVAKGHQYPDVLLLDTLKARVPILYFHNKHLYAEFGDNRQNLITRSEPNHTYKIYMPDVLGGDSGGPVFTCGIPRLAGIIVSGDASCEVLGISHIMKIIKKEIPGLVP